MFCFKNFKMRKYIFWFAQEHVEFRRAEIDSLAALFNIEWRKLLKTDEELPFWLVELPGHEAALKLASRSISLRCIIELWSHANSIAAFHEKNRDFVKLSHSSVQDYFASDKSFKIVVETYNKHFSQAEKVAKIETFTYLPFEGNVDLRNPDNEWWYIEFYGLNPRDVPPEPYHVLFGKWVADGQRNLIKELSLKKRKFIGNTSMDAQLSILMANQGKVKPGDLVFDPFVGTGSLLVSSAKFGGYVLGADIDYLMLHAKTRPSRITQKYREKDESVRANLKQYNCEDKYLDVLVSDFSNTIWRDELEFDCIITDPPYGIREATERIDTKVTSKPDTRTDGVPHYPSTSHYTLYNLYSDLLTFSAKHLKMNGRLVCWLPIYKEDYNEEVLPKHPNLVLIANSEQTLSALTARRLLTYEKISNYSQTIDEEKHEELAFIDFRQKYFAYGEESRKERRMLRAQLREIGKQEALKRGKILDVNGKIKKK